MISRDIAVAAVLGFAADPEALAVDLAAVTRALRFARTLARSMALLKHPRVHNTVAVFVAFAATQGAFQPEALDRFAPALAAAAQAQEDGLRLSAPPTVLVGLSAPIRNTGAYDCSSFLEIFNTFTKAVPNPGARGSHTIGARLDAWALANPQHKRFRWSNGEYCCNCTHRRPSAALACARRCGISEVQIVAG